MRIIHLILSTDNQIITWKYILEILEMYSISTMSLFCKLKKILLSDLYVTKNMTEHLLVVIPTNVLILKQNLKISSTSTS